MSNDKVEKIAHIRRATHAHDNPYFQMARATAQDRSLSFEARGALAYLLSKPDNWRVQPSDLQQTCGKAVVYRILKELIEHGYIQRLQERDEKKRVTAWVYLVYETPNENLLPKNQEVGKLEVAFRDITYNRELHKREETIPPPDNVLMETTHATEDVPEKPHPPVAPAPLPKKHKANARVGRERAALYARLAEVEDLTAALLKQFDKGYDPAMRDPKSYMTMPHLEKYIPAAEDLARAGAKPEDIAAVYAYLKPRYQANQWTIGIKSIVENYAAWKAHRAGQAAAGAKRAQIIALNEPKGAGEWTAEDFQAMRESLTSGGNS